MPTRNPSTSPPAKLTRTGARGKPTGFPKPSDATVQTVRVTKDQIIAHNIKMQERREAAKKR